MECPLAKLYHDISFRTKVTWNNLWKNEQTCRISKIFWPNIEHRISKQILALSRTKLRLIIYTTTGHWNIGKHASRIGITKDTHCKGCDTEIGDVDPFHFWCDCPGLARARMEHLNEFFLYQYPDIKVIGIDNLLNFIKKTGWF